MSQTNPQTVLLSYANAAFDRALTALTAEAGAFPFTAVCAVREADLAATEFWQAHGDFVRTHPRGGGYWLWKPFLVQRLLASLADGDVLVYADAGCALDAAKLPRFAEYVAAVTAHPSGVLAFEMPHPQRVWTKAAVVAEMRGPVDLDAGQVAATSFMLRVSPETRRLIAEWYGLCADYRLLDDSPSRTADGAALPEDPAFREHRHDQAIWSLLVRQSAPLLIPDEMWPPGAPETGPIVAARRR